MVMQLEDFILKWGVESGTKRFNGSKKREETKRLKYSQQPYKRMTKDWCIWRYGEELGIQKYDSFVSKSLQSIDNFIKRHGEIEGLKKYNETMIKKNTIELLRDSCENDVEQIISDRYDRASKERKKNWDNLDIREQEEHRKLRIERSKATRVINGTAGKKFPYYIKKYGEIDGPIKYAEHLQKCFKSIGNSAQSTNFIKNIILNNSWLNNFSLYYRDKEDIDLKEWFISTTEGVYFYDFCVKEAKVMLEYDGAMWHPTIEQSILLSDVPMEIIGTTYKDKFNKDIKKIQIAESKGFIVFVVRSDFSDFQKQEVVNLFLNEVKKRIGYNE